MSDNNLISYYDKDSHQTVHHEIIGDSSLNYDDALKITSRCAGLNVHAKAIRGGREDCVDINNHASAIKVLADRWLATGKYVATIKGGASDVFLWGRIERGGSEVDVDLGNWSDQSQAKTENVRLHLSRADGKPVTVRVLHAEKPLLLPNDKGYRYAFPHPDAFYHRAVVAVFFAFKRLSR